MKRLSVLLPLVLGCGDPGQLGRSVVSPSDVTANVALEDVPVRGSDVTIDRTDDTSVKGELLAATERDVTVLLSSGTILRIAADVVRRVTIKRYDNGLPVAVLAAWSVAGALGGLTQGALAIAGEPIWGGFSAGAIVPVAADEGRFAFTDRRSDFTFLHEYARFPQGLPPQYASRVRLTAE
jgi:hypothetical protein